MRRKLSRFALPIMAAILTGAVVARPSSFEPAAGGTMQVSWRVRSIPVAISTSLLAPSTAIKPNSDVTGAIRRALQTWSSAANVVFVPVMSTSQSVSSADLGDGISLITIAATSENLGVFRDQKETARTRLFFDETTGAISEADIVLNPFVFSANGELIEFSTDGTPGTYDLESTLAHEIGHLLGLEHSNVIGATMQPTQGVNGINGTLAIGQRTLSETDRAAARSLYGPREKFGSLEGTISRNVDGTIVPLVNAQIWLEDVTTGTVMGSGTSVAGGKFTLAGLTPGSYRVMAAYPDGPTPALKSRARARPLRTVEMSSDLRIEAGREASLNYIVASSQTSPQSLQPQIVGTAEELSTVPIALTPGSKITLYVAGKGLQDVPGSGLSISSPLITVDPASLVFHDLKTPMISFDVSVASSISPGDYSLKLQANSGEVAYLVGVINIEPKP